jgi:hypothetical protein
MQFSFFKGGIKKTVPTISISLVQLVEMIKGTEYKEAVEKLRSATDASLKKVMKSALDYVTISGEFKSRSESTLIKHSGLLCIDFDKLEELDACREKLQADPLTHALFLSPSGNGLKLVVKIDPAQHKESFYWLEGYYLHTYGLTIDEACKDISRACFISYDPLCFYNAESVAPELPKEEYDADTGEVINTVRVPEDKEKSFRLVEAYVKKLEAAKKDITADYKDWLEICFSMAVFGETGRDLFHRVSQFNEKYNKQDADYKFTNAVKTSKFTTPAKFISLCKTYNIKVKPIKTISEARAEGTEIDENTDWQFMDMRFKSLMDLDEVQKKSVRQYRLVEVKGRYYSDEGRNEKSMTVSMVPFSNFIIRPLFLIKSKTEPKRIIEIENIYGVKKTVDVPTDAFTSIGEFNKFIESQGNFLFTVKSPPFTLLKVKVYEQTADALEVKTLGWHKDAAAYIFANGGFKDGKFYPIDDYGILTLPRRKAKDEEPEEEKDVDRYFLPAMSDIYRDSEDSFENEKKFIYIKRPDVSFETWASLFHIVHKQNGMVAMLHYMAAIFSDFIYSKKKWFPHLFLFGVPGSGKSTLGWSLSYMFGEAQTPYQLNSGTLVALARLFAAFRNGMVWTDEFNNNEIDEKKFQLLKGSYDRTGHAKGEMSSNRNTITPTNSCAIISGQHLPTRDNAALFKRSNLLQFYSTDHTEEDQTNLKKLQAMEQKGLSHITAALMMFRDKVEDEFERVFEETVKEFNPLLLGVETRIVQNAMVTVTMYKLTADKLKYPFSYEEVKAFTVKNVNDQHRLIASSKETSVFWDLAMFMLAQAMVKEKEDFHVRHLNMYRVTGEGGKSIEKEFTTGTTGILYLSMAKIHPLYMKLHREQHNKIGMDKNSLLHYLRSMPSYLGSNDKIRFGEHVTNAYLFNHDMLITEGYDFERAPDTGADEGGEAKAFPNQPPQPPNDSVQAEKDPPSIFDLVSV